jgi:hypothetical protein
MPVPQAVQRAYDEALPVVRALDGIVRPTIAKWASDNGHFFRARVKTAESLGEKLEGGRVRSWAEIDDLFACMIVIPTPNALDGTIAYLRRTFQERSMRGRGIAQKPPDVFRFDAPRFVGTLQPEEGVERLDGVDQMLFEVQVLTAFEYAWHVATHDEIFKGAVIDWRRARLAAHLKAAVEQADGLITAFDLSVETISVSPHRDTERRARLTEALRSLVDSGGIADALVPGSWARFGENTLALIRSYADGDIDQEIDRLTTAIALLAGRGDVPVSGSLFQLVVSAVVDLNGVDALQKYVIVDSDELRDIYRIAAVPTPMTL